MTCDNSVLLIVDVQGNLALSMFDRSRLLTNLQRLIRSMPVLHVPLAVVEQSPEKLGPTLPVLMTSMENAPVFSKRTFSAWRAPALAAHLETLQRTHVVVTGIETHVCVYQTVRDACQAGYTVSVVADAVASRSESNYRFGLDMCRDAGASLTTTEAILFDWMTSVDHPAFRTVLQQVR